MWSHGYGFVFAVRRSTFVTTDRHDFLTLVSFCHSNHLLSLARIVKHGNMVIGYHMGDCTYSALFAQYPCARLAVNEVCSEPYTAIPH